MVKAIHAAAHLADCLNRTTAMQLQTLLYHSQGCHLALHGEPLFDDPIEAWSIGPVVRSVWPQRQRLREIESPWPDATTLNEAQRELSADAISVLDAVAGTLGGWTAAALTESARQESPWKLARGDLPADAHSQTKIDADAIRRFFKSFCLASRRELSREELSPAAFKLYICFENLRAFTPPTVAAEDAESWIEAFEAPPRDLPDLRQFLTSTKARPEA